MIAVALPRFIKLGANGQETDGAHVAVLDNSTGLIWDAGETDSMTWTAAKTHCAKLRTAGFEDWRLPTVAELVGLVDYTRRNPAIDIEAFANCKPDWYWTGVPAACSPGVGAWLVDFGGGYANWYSRDFGGFVRAVRPSQLLAHRGSR